jgi:Protein of unknown function (DUF3761)
MDTACAIDHDRSMNGKLRVLLATASILLATSGAAAAHSLAHQAASPSRAHAADCKRGYYKNVSGHCVRRPVKAATAPAGATAKCRDGSYSFSEHASGTCSHHGGVLRWIHHP